MHTVDTIMVLSNLRVHVAPVGFEIDRIVLSAKKMKADKVWLLVHRTPSEDKARTFIEKIKNQLRKANIEVATALHDRLDLFNIIKTVKEIIQNEKENDVYVNLSSGSKIHAIGCMMACMMFNDRKNIKPFYAEAEHYPGFEGKQQSTGVKKILSVPAYEIQIPRSELIQALKIIKEHDGRITKKEMAKLAEEKDLIVVNARDENFEQARFASLDKNIIQPLVDQWKFIEVEKIGRNRWIKITEAGSQASEFLN